MNKKTEHDNSFSVLDIKITRHNHQFKISVYEKRTFSDSIYAL